jgi:hypothetical protein
VLVAARRRDGSAEFDLVRTSRAPGGRLVTASCGPCRAQPLRPGLIRWGKG